MLTVLLIFPRWYVCQVDPQVQIQVTCRLAVSRQLAAMRPSRHQMQRALASRSGLMVNNALCWSVFFNRSANNTFSKPIIDNENDFSKSLALLLSYSYQRIFATDINSTQTLYFIGFVALVPSCSFTRNMNIKRNCDFTRNERVVQVMRQVFRFKCVFYWGTKQS